MSDVRASFSRTNDRAFGKKFYEKLLDADPKIAALFKNTDFTKQYELLVHGIIVLIDYAEGNAMGQLAIKRLAEKHSRKKLNVSPQLYSLWIDCFVKTMAELDPKFTPDLGRQWRATLQQGIDAMIKAY
jgi:hemoglobin-like flavoprotein